MDSLNTRDIFMIPHDRFDMIPIFHIRFPVKLAKIEVF
jgi:hypothetical protein